MVKITGLLEQKALEKINKGVCPFCGKSKWGTTLDTIQLLNTEELKKIVRGNTWVNPQELIKVECGECGYIAYFDYRKLTR